jgi:polyhydroxyalkanoate synthesis regulator phasin
MSYNDWTNKETWLVRTWFDHIFDEMVESGETITPETIKTTVYDLIENGSNSIEDGFLRDLLHSALAEINWQELSDFYQED